MEEHSTKRMTFRPLMRGVSDISRALQSSDVIPQSSISKYDRYIRVARFCVGCGELFPFVVDPNGIALLTGNRTNTPIRLVHLSHFQLFPLHPFVFLICVEGIW